MQLLSKMNFRFSVTVEHILFCDNKTYKNKITDNHLNVTMIALMEARYI